MKCPKCGYPLPENSEFCQYCGTRLTLQSSSDMPVEKAGISTSTTSTAPIAKSIPKPASEIFPTAPQPEDAQEMPIIHRAYNSYNEHTEVSPVSSSSHEKSGTAAKPIISTAAPKVEAETSSNSNRKQAFCKKCGAAIDPTTKKCTGCGKQYFKAKITIPLVLLFVLLITSAGINVVQCLREKATIETVASQAAKIEELEKTVASQKSAISSQKSTIASQKNIIALFEEKSGYFDTICKELSSGNLGYAADNFRASESVIVVDRNETNRKFTLTANWTKGGSVLVEYSHDVAVVSFDNDSWTMSTKMTINPRHPGVTSVTFSNNVDSRAFKILIIVT